PEDAERTCVSSAGLANSSSMISSQRSTHSSQMYTPGPRMSFLTCFWLFPQNEYLSKSPPSPMRATQQLLHARPPQRPGYHLGSLTSRRLRLLVHPSVVERYFPQALPRSHSGQAERLGAIRTPPIMP